MAEAPPPPPPFAAEAAGTTQSAGQSVDEGRGRVFPCGQCGADLKFSIGAQSLECPYCSHVTLLEFAEDADVREQDLPALLRRLRELRDGELEQPSVDDKHEVRCDACGANVVFVGTLTSSECPYCASPIQRENVHTAEQRAAVDGVLPFLVEQQQAAANLRKWIRSRWFAPNDFRRRAVAGKINGVYLPFFTYDAMTFTRYSGQRGEHYWVETGSGDKKRRERRTRWYPASGAFQRFFDDVLVLAARGLHTKLLTKLEPWPLGKCLPFNQQLLAGFSARTYDVEIEEGFTEAKRRIESALDSDVRSRIGGDEQRVWSIDSQFSALTFKHLLLPVWLLAYRYRDKTYQVMINAATGEVQGERPYSWIKITLAVLAVVALAAGIFFLVQR